MAFEVDKRVDDDFDDSGLDYDTRILVFGVGGGGGNAVANMAETEVTDVSYVVANTDVGALRSKDGSKMKRLQLGRKTTRGRGAGNNPAVGKQAAEESHDEIAAMLDGFAMIFIAAGMGGGTGTGAAPVVASIAKEMGLLTVGVVTKPFVFEGESKMNQALKGIAEMKQYVDALIVVPNERVKQIAKLTVKDAFKTVDDILYKAVFSIISIVSNIGYINVDFADVTATLKQSGIAHMAIGHGKGDNRIEDVINEVFHSPLLETSISGARKGLLSVRLSPSCPMDDYNNLVTSISSKFYDGAEFKAGVVLDDTLEEDEISVIAVATDFVTEQSGTNSGALPERGGQTGQQAQSEPMQSAQPSPDVFSTSDKFNDAQDIDTLLDLFNRNKSF